MCGLLFYAGQKNKTKTFEKGLKQLEHRGPDATKKIELLDQALDLNSFRYRKVGHTRLSIVDDLQSKQPMQKEDIILAFNGEIYNFVEIRSELISQGVKFKTQGDTEVLLESYKKWGRSCFDRFIGMWAFVLIDSKEKKIIASRDRLGVKPLYFFYDAEQLVIGSEIKSLIPFLDNVYGNREEAIKYLIYGPQENDRATMFSGISRIFPSEVVEFDFSGKKLGSYHFYKPNIDNNGGYDFLSACRDIQTYLNDAVSIRLKTDKDVALTLSAGVDSNIILCSSSEKDVSTFTVNYPDGPSGLNEFKLIENKIKKQNIKNKVVSCTGDVVKSKLREVIWYQDEPFDTLGIFAQNLLYKSISEDKIKISIDGQGADEIFLGYESMKSSVLLDALLRFDIKYIIANKDLLNIRVLRHAFLTTFPGLFERLYFYKRARKYSLKYKDFIKSSKRSFFKRLTASHLIVTSVREHLTVLLRYVDRNSMQYSVEARAPFLDYRLLDLALRLDFKKFFNFGLGKFVLREAFRGKVDNGILFQKKKLGFPVPEDKWMESISANYFMDLKESNLLKSLGVKVSEDNRYDWKIYCLFIWTEVFDIQGWKV